MPRRALAVAVAVALAPAPPAEARRAPRHRPASTIVLDGEPTPVGWSDGDTFRIRGGPRRDGRARLAGVNTLESYGPVHRFAGMSGDELLAISRDATALVRTGDWHCGVLRGRGGYGRLLVSCPDAAEALVRAGYAMVLAVDSPPDARLVARQREAQRARAGMWAGGVPPIIPTSLHSAGESRRLRGRGYDRVVDTRTGVSWVRRHHRSYAVCEEVCVSSGQQLACMTYVPFMRQHRNRPSCLARPRSR